MTPDHLPKRNAGSRLESVYNVFEKVVAFLRLKIVFVNSVYCCASDDYVLCPNELTKAMTLNELTNITLHLCVL